MEVKAIKEELKQFYLKNNLDKELLEKYINSGATGLSYKKYTTLTNDMDEKYFNGRDQKNIRYVEKLVEEWETNSKYLMESEAKRRGFVGTIKIKHLWSEEIVEINCNNFHWNSLDKYLYIGGGKTIIFEQGKWAEIIAEEKVVKTIDQETLLALALTKYIKAKHTQEECIGFIAGFEAALKSN